MKRISSRQMFIHKKLFPLAWFGFMGVFLYLVGSAGPFDKRPLFIGAPLAMAVLGFFMMKKLVWDLVDEVWDCGNHLLVRNRGQEERIPLARITNVSASLLVNPPRVTLLLAAPGSFGDRISFSPALPFSPLNVLRAPDQHPFVDDLIRRVDAARRQERR